MKKWAMQHTARNYCIEIMGTRSVGVCLAEEPGRMMFAFPVRYALSAAQSVAKKLGIPEGDPRHRFERTAHYIADTFYLDGYRSIIIKHTYGSLRATVTLIDNEDEHGDQA